VFKGLRNLEISNSHNL